MPSSASNVLQFDRFTLDLARGQLRAGDSVIELRLRRPMLPGGEH
jgi:hypothetical protein